MRTADGKTDIELTVSLRRTDGRDWDLARASVPVEFGDAATLEGEVDALRGLAARAVDALAAEYAEDRAAEFTPLAGEGGN